MHCEAGGWTHPSPIAFLHCDLVPIALCPSRAFLTSSFVVHSLILFFQRGVVVCTDERLKTKRLSVVQIIPSGLKSPIDMRTSNGMRGCVLQTYKVLRDQGAACDMHKGHCCFASEHYASELKKQSLANYEICADPMLCKRTRNGAHLGCRRTLSYHHHGCQSKHHTWCSLYFQQIMSLMLCCKADVEYDPSNAQPRTMQPTQRFQTCCSILSFSSRGPLECIIFTNVCSHARSSRQESNAHCLRARSFWVHCSGFVSCIAVCVCVCAPGMHSNCRPVLLYRMFPWDKACILGYWSHRCTCLNEKQPRTNLHSQQTDASLPVRTWLA